jgi:hypothetical protein
VGSDRMRDGNADVVRRGRGRAAINGTRQFPVGSYLVSGNSPDKGYLVIQPGKQHSASLLGNQVSVTPSYLASECLRAPKGPRTVIMRYWQKALLPINPWP